MNNGPLSKTEPAPVLSVVVVSLNGPDSLERCLSALRSQPDARRFEIHVVSKEPRRDTWKGDGLAPRIHWHQAPPTETVPGMRRIGIRRAGAGIVALLEDDCTVGRHWFRSALAAHGAGHEVVGGAVEPGPYARGLDWGVFYCEYARFLEPFSGSVTALPGNNVSYQSEILGPELMEQGFYEVFVHEMWRQAGVVLHAAEGMVVTNRNRWQLAHCTSVPFHHGRAYAAQRFGKRYSTKRLLYGLLAIGLPWLKSARTLGEIFSRHRAELPVLRALPWILLFHGCWSMGELAGYLAGPGDSIERWG